MRVGLMLRTLDEQYGIGQYTRNMLDELLQIDAGHEYLLMYRGEQHLGSYAQHANVRETVVPARNKLLWDQLAVPRLARREGLDVLFHSKFTVPLRSPCKTVMVLHGTEWFVYPESYPWWDIQYVRLMMPLYMRRADGVICVSDRARLDISKMRGVDPGKLRTVYLAANRRFQVIDDRETLEQTRRRLKLPERFILYVGKIYPGKNVGNILRSFARIRERVPHKLVICGAPYYKYEQDLALIDELGLADDVVRPGYVPPEELPAVYNLADLFLFPSRYESCPAPPWEAMASGCPVVTSPTGGTGEIVGDAAELIDPEDVEGIAAGCLRVLTDDAHRHELVRRGFEQVKRFSWRKCARETLEVIEAVGR